MSSSSTGRPVFTLDEDAFRRRIPYNLIGTNVKGAYATPAPSDNFDPNTASATELIKQGLLWRRPTSADPPAFQQAWKKVFSRKWLAKDRIVPQMEVQVGKTHNLRKPLVNAADQNFLNGAWSGAGMRGGPWAGIIGSWNIPTVSAPSEPQGLSGGWDSSSWIGLDGFDIGIVSNDVLQAGVQQSVSSSGVTSYVAWFEWFVQGDSSPDYVFQTNITNFPVSPGQQVYVAIQYLIPKTGGSIFFANDTTGQNFSITLAPPPGATFAGNSIEWILEAPDGGEPITAIPKFTPVTFTMTVACPVSGNIDGNAYGGDTLNIETTSGKVLTSVTTAPSTATITFIG
jgi:hypothetical protein